MSGEFSSKESTAIIGRHTNPFGLKRLERKGVKARQLW